MTTELQTYSIYFSYYECLANASDESSSPVFEEMFDTILIEAPSEFHAGMTFQATHGDHNLTVLEVKVVEVELVSPYSSDDEF